MWVMPFWEVSRLTYPPHVVPTHPLIHPPIISKIAYKPTHSSTKAKMIYLPHVIPTTSKITYPSELYPSVIPPSNSSTKAIKPITYKKIKHQANLKLYAVQSI